MPSGLFFLSVCVPSFVCVIGAVPGVLVPRFLDLSCSQSVGFSVNRFQGWQGLFCMRTVCELGMKIELASVFPHGSVKILLCGAGSSPEITDVCDAPWLWWLSARFSVAGALVSRLSSIG